MLYSYKCLECSTEFEISASFATLSLLNVNRPVCMTDKVKRIYNVPNFILKGKDFYKNSARKNDKE